MKEETPINHGNKAPAEWVEGRVSCHGDSQRGPLSMESPEFSPVYGNLAYNVSFP